MKFSFYCLFLLIFGISFYTNCQDDYNINYNNYIRNELLKLKNSYDSSTYDSSAFITGKLAREISLSKHNHPYYKENEWFKGMIYFDTIFYPVSSIKYNIFRDEILYLNRINNNVYPMGLNNTLIKKFSLDNYEFEFLGNLKTSTGNSLINGYYQIFYKGNTSLFGRWEKYKSIDDSSRDYEYKLTMYYILQKNNKYYKLKNMVKLRYILRDHKAEIKKYIRDNNLNSTDDFSIKAANIVSYYDSLAK